MTNRILCSLAAAMLAPLGLMPVPAIAQTTGDQVLYACYIPLVGVVYRIKEPGLPVACLGRNHVEFHWNAQGPRGERGEAGTPGNLLLAGQSCPTGYFVSGFNQFGGLDCRNSSGEAVPPTPVPPTSNPLEGLWGLTAILTMRCTSTLGTAMFSVVSMRTELSASGHLLATLYGPISFPGFFTETGIATLDMGSVPSPLVFPFATSGSGNTAAPSPLVGSVAYSFSGSFASATQFSGTVEVTPDLTIRVAFPGVPPVETALNCPPFAGRIDAVK
jgi:hypothetical protein